MCTVSYLPLSHHGFIITSNRDEAPHRNAIGVQRAVREERTLLYPVDPAAGGSWFCAAADGRVACLLNGAFVPFTHDPKYTESRGHALLNVLTWQSATQFAAEYDFARTAPFTLVVAGAGAVDELIWDGAQVHLRAYDASQPAFWSSVTLYPEDVRKWRRALFEQWITAQESFTQVGIVQFHQYGATDDPWNGFVMNRNDRVKTLSITSVQYNGTTMLLHHADLVRDVTTIETIEVVDANVEKN